MRVPPAADTIPMTTPAPSTEGRAQPAGYRRTTESRIYAVTHKGQQLLVLDFSAMEDTPELVRFADAAAARVAKEPPGSVRVLGLVRPVGRFDKDGIAAVRRMVEHNRPYVRATALVGLSGVVRVIHQAMQILSRRQMPNFESEAEAKEWLVAQ